MYGRPEGRSRAFQRVWRRRERALKRFLYARLYGLPELQPIRDEADRVVANLAAAYRANPSLLPDDCAEAGKESIDCGRSATSSPE